MCAMWARSWWWAGRSKALWRGWASCVCLFAMCAGAMNVTNRSNQSRCGFVCKVAWNDHKRAFIFYGQNFGGTYKKGKVILKLGACPWWIMMCAYYFHIEINKYYQHIAILLMVGSISPYTHLRPSKFGTVLFLLGTPYFWWLDNNKYNLYHI